MYIIISMFIHKSIFLTIILISVRISNGFKESYHGGRLLQKIRDFNNQAQDFVKQEKPKVNNIQNTPIPQKQIKNELKNDNKLSNNFNNPIPQPNISPKLPKSNIQPQNEEIQLQLIQLQKQPQLKTIINFIPQINPYYSVVSTMNNVNKNKFYRAVPNDEFVKKVEKEDSKQQNQPKIQATGYKYIPAINDSYHAIEFVYQTSKDRFKPKKKPNYYQSLLNQKSQREQPKKKQTNKEQPKRQQPQRAQPKRQQPQRAQPKRQQPQRAQPKRQQPQRAQPKRQQPKRQQPKRQQPKIQQPKKQQPKKEQPEKFNKKIGEKQIQIKKYESGKLPEVKQYNAVDLVYPNQKNKPIIPKKKTDVNNFTPHIKVVIRQDNQKNYLKNEGLYIIMTIFSVIVAIISNKRKNKEKYTILQSNQQDLAGFLK